VVSPPAMMHAGRGIGRPLPRRQHKPRMFSHTVRDVWGVCEECVRGV
jgi:hypothetical protein